jgi:Fe2+ transport system protein FeoA
MLLSDIQMGKSVSIVDVNAETALKKRLRTLGLTKNCNVTVLEESIGRQNMKISFGSTEIALRIDEARQITVEEIV